MARKLFALESEGDDVEMMDSGSEVGEVAEAQNETVEDTTDIGETSDGLTDGLEATDDLENVEGVIEDSIESGEGLDPVAAEAIRIAVECIAKKVGANPRSVYTLYATENFKSASSRMSNTAIALEGVKDFLKDMWKKIKETLTKIWTKVKAFWDKHVSTLGRVKKALESMKIKVSESSGKFKDKAYLDEAPSSLVEAFAGKTDIGDAVVSKYIANHVKFSVSSAELIADTEKWTVASTLTDLTKPFDLETKHKGSSEPLIGGVIYTATIDTVSDSEEGGVTIEIEKEVIDKESKLGISISGKDKLKTHLTETLAVINDAIKYKEKVGKYNEAVTKAMAAITKSVETQYGEKMALNGDNAEEKSAKEHAPNLVKIRRAKIKQFYKINAKTPTLFSDQLTFNIKLAKAVMSYSAFCLKQYK